MNAITKTSNDQRECLKFFSVLTVAKVKQGYGIRELWESVERGKWYDDASPSTCNFTLEILIRSLHSNNCREHHSALVVTSPAQRVALDKILETRNLSALLESSCSISHPSHLFPTIVSFSSLRSTFWAFSRCFFYILF